MSFFKPGDFDKQIELDARQKFSLQCEAPCDSYGVCDNCSEINLILIGMEMTIKAINAKRDAEFERMTKAMDEAKKVIEFYASEWGPHHGSPIKAVNEFTMNRMNKTRELAIEWIKKYTAVRNE